MLSPFEASVTERSSVGCMIRVSLGKGFFHNIDTHVPFDILHPTWKEGIATWIRYAESIIKI